MPGSSDWGGVPSSIVIAPLDFPELAPELDELAPAEDDELEPELPQAPSAIATMTANSVAAAGLVYLCNKAASSSEVEFPGTII